MICLRRGLTYECNVNLPLLDHKSGMIQSVHLNYKLSHDIDNTCQIKQPAEEVDIASKEPDHTSPSRAWGNGGPVVHASSRGNC